MLGPIVSQLDCITFKGIMTWISYYDRTLRPMEHVYIKKVQRDTTFLPQVISTFLIKCAYFIIFYFQYYSNAIG